MSSPRLAIAYTLVVFLAGVLAGAVTMNLYEHFVRHREGHVITPQSWGRVSDRAHYLEKLNAELQLTEAQSKQMEAILDETMQQYNDLHSFSHHIRQEGINRIRAMLNDTQRKRFDQSIRNTEGPLENTKSRKPQ